MRAWFPTIFLSHTPPYTWHKLSLPRRVDSKKTELNISFRGKIKETIIISLHLRKPIKSHICPICHIFNSLIILVITHGLKVLQGKFTRILTYIVREDISSCFDSNNVGVVIEDFECYRTVIFVCKRHKLTTTINAIFLLNLFSMNTNE